MWARDKEVTVVANVFNFSLGSSLVAYRATLFQFELTASDDDMAY